MARHILGSGPLVPDDWGFGPAEPPEPAEHECDYTDAEYLGVGAVVEGCTTCGAERDGAPCCPDPGCNGNPCEFPGYVANN